MSCWPIISAGECTFCTDVAKCPCQKNAIFSVNGRFAADHPLDPPGGELQRLAAQLLAGGCPRRRARLLGQRLDRLRRVVELRAAGWRRLRGRDRPGVSASATYACGPWRTRRVDLGPGRREPGAPQQQRHVRPARHASIFGALSRRSVRRMFGLRKALVSRARCRTARARKARATVSRPSTSIRRSAGCGELLLQVAVDQRHRLRRDRRSPGRAAR